MGVTKYLLLVLLAGCGKQPPSNTEAYNNLHGVYNDGKTINVITLSAHRDQPGPQLRFPPAHYINVFTAGIGSAEPAIKMGRATSVRTTLSFKLNGDTGRMRDEPVYVVFQGIDPQSRPNDYVQLQVLMKDAVFDRDELQWGLRRFTVTSFGDLHTYRYIAADDNVRFPDGRPVLIGCHSAGSRESGKVPGSCSASLIVGRTLAVGFRFDAVLLPQWKVVAGQVYSLASSVLVP